MNHRAYSDAPQVVLQDDPAVLPVKENSGNIDAAAIPRRGALIRDMKASTFWLIISLIAILVIVVVVGGSVGGAIAVKKQNAESLVPSAAESSTTGSPTTRSVILVSPTTSTPPSATSTTITQIDCPGSNGTVYTSYLFGNINPEPPSSTGFKFLKLCSYDIVATNLVFTSTSTFNDCIELCASTNYYYGKALCQSVTYTYGSGSPVCWIHSGSPFASGFNDNAASAVLAS